MALGRKSGLPQVNIKPKKQVATWKSFIDDILTTAILMSYQRITEQDNYIRFKNPDFFSATAHSLLRIFCQSALVNDFENRKKTFFEAVSPIKFFNPFKWISTGLLVVNMGTGIIIDGIAHLFSPSDWFEKKSDPRTASKPIATAVKYAVSGILFLPIALLSPFSYFEKTPISNGLRSYWEATKKPFNQLLSVFQNNNENPFKTNLAYHADFKRKIDTLSIVFLNTFVRKEKREDFDSIFKGKKAENHTKRVLSKDPTYNSSMTYLTSNITHNTNNATTANNHVKQQLERAEGARNLHKNMGLEIKEKKDKGYFTYWKFLNPLRLLQATTNVLITGTSILIDSALTGNDKYSKTGAIIAKSIFTYPLMIAAAAIAPFAELDRVEPVKTILNTIENTIYSGISYLKKRWDSRNSHANTEETAPLIHEVEPETTTIEPGKTRSNSTMIIMNAEPSEIKSITGTAAKPSKSLDSDDESMDLTTSSRHSVSSSSSSLTRSHSSIFSSSDAKDEKPAKIEEVNTTLTFGSKNNSSDTK